jgi:hypothetical protein
MFLQKDEIPPEMLKKVAPDFKVHSLRHIALVLHFDDVMSGETQTRTFLDGLHEAIEYNKFTPEDVSGKLMSVIYLEMTTMQMTNIGSNVYFNTNICDQIDLRNVRKSNVPLKDYVELSKPFITFPPMNGEPCTVGTNDRMVMLNQESGLCAGMFNVTEETRGIGVIPDGLDGGRLLMSVTHIDLISMERWYREIDFKNPDFYVSMDKNAFDYYKRESDAMLRNVNINYYTPNDVKFSAWVREGRNADAPGNRFSVVIKGWVLFFDEGAVYPRCHLKNNDFMLAHGIDLMSSAK